MKNSRLEQLLSQLALYTNIRLDKIYLPRTNTVAYLARKTKNGFIRLAFQSQEKKIEQIVKDEDIF
jgi:hypothetical protein